MQLLTTIPRLRYRTKRGDGGERGGREGGGREGERERGGLRSGGGGDTCNTHATQKTSTRRRICHSQGTSRPTQNVHKHTEHDRERAKQKHITELCAAKNTTCPLKGRQIFNGAALSSFLQTLVRAIPAFSPSSSHGRFLALKPNLEKFTW